MFLLGSRRLVWQSCVDNMLGDTDVTLHEKRLNEQRVRTVVKTARPRQIVREAIHDVDVDAKQITHSVAVLAMGQSFRRLESRIVDLAVVELIDRIVQCEHHLLAFVVARLLRVFWRHDVILRLLDHIDPLVAFLDDR